MELRHHETDSKGSYSIYAGSDKCAEITYSKAGPQLIIIDHTEVDEQFSGKGYGKLLVETLIEMVEENNIKILPLCPFAKAFFDKNPQYNYVLK